MVQRIGILLSIFLSIGLLPAASVDAETPQTSNESQTSDKSPISDKEDYYELQKLLVDTLDQVERNYVHGISRRRLVEAAIRGVISELDPYSAYIAPEDISQFRTAVDSQFGGIGIRISMDRRQLKVLSPLVGTPAYKMGVLAGDRIMKIDGRNTKGFSLDDAVKRLKGEPNTEVTLTVIHPGKTEEQEITIGRAVVQIETVLGDHRKPDDSWDFLLDEQARVGYIRLTAFSRNTARELRRGLAELKKAGVRGLILDLRFNPGGLLTSAIDVSNLFISEGRIVSTEGRNMQPKEWNARARGTFDDFKMVVLVNRFSASASEIVSACLQDHQRAVIMGERTWGKGSVQNVIEMENGQSALKLTTAGYHRPSGKNINRAPDATKEDEWGVIPDEGYQLRLTDQQMFALVEDRRRRDIVQPGRPDQSQQPRRPEESAPSEETEPRQPSESSQEGQPAAAKAERSEDDREEEPSAPAQTPSGKEAPAASERDGPQPEDAPMQEDHPAAEPDRPQDSQLQMAIDYLTEELARAE